MSAPHDCCWWALSLVLQRTLAEPLPWRAKGAGGMQGGISTGSHTVYSRLVAPDAEGRVRAVSAEAFSGAPPTGTTLDAALCQLGLGLPDPQLWRAALWASSLSDGQPTCIYVGQRRAPGSQTPGGRDRHRLNAARVPRHVD